MCSEMSSAQFSGFYFYIFIFLYIANIHKLFSRALIKELNKAGQAAQVLR